MIVPDGDARVTVRPMFGNTAAFVNGNMFMGLFGDDLFLRLSEDDGAEIMKNNGASPFEPMKGRPMRGYFLIPKAWRKSPETARSWVTRSLESTGKMPPKKQQQQRRKQKKATG